jgi:hypothetical protein
MQGTADLHHDIANALLPQANPVFHDAGLLQSRFCKEIVDKSERRSSRVVLKKDRNQA